MKSTPTALRNQTPIKESIQEILSALMKAQSYEACGAELAQIYYQGRYCAGEHFTAIAHLFPLILGRRIDTDSSAFIECSKGFMNKKASLLEAIHRHDSYFLCHTTADRYLDYEQSRNPLQQLREVTNGVFLEESC